MSKKYLDDAGLSTLANEILQHFQKKLTFDSTPTSGSQNPVTSGGVYSALSTKQDTLTIDTIPTFNSSNPVTSGGVYTALSVKQNKLTAGDNITIQDNVISATGGGGGGMSGIVLVNKNEDIITSITRVDGNHVNNLSNTGGGSYLRIKLNKTLTWTSGKFYQINIWNSLSAILTQCSGTFCGFYVGGLTQYHGFVGIWNTANAVNSAVLTNLFIPYSKKEIDIGIPSAMPTSETDNMISNFDKFKFEIIEY